MNYKRLYTKVIKRKRLNIFSLLLCGFGIKGIKELLRNGTIKKEDFWHIKFLDVNGLYHYGKDLLNSNNKDSAIKTFEKCFELDPRHISTNYRLFVINCLDDKYDEALTYLSNLLDAPIYQEDNNLYLVVLGFLIDLPDSLKKRLHELKIPDILLRKDDPRYPNVLEENALRKAIFNKNIKQAKKLINRIIESNYANTIKNSLLKKGLYDIDIQNRKNYKLVNTLIKEEKYQEALELLESIQKRQKISNYYTYILILLNDLLIFKNNGHLNLNNVTHTNSLYEAINNKAYVLALYLCIKQDEEKSIDSSSNALYLLLNAINKEINKKYPVSLEEKPKRELNEEQYIEYLNSLMPNVEKHGMFVLPLTDSERRDLLERIAGRFSNIKTFKITFESETYLVLKYHVLKETDVVALKERAESFEEKKAYEEAIKCYREILIHTDADYFIYAKLGLLYSYIYKNNTAIHFFYVANYLAKVAGEDLDFTKLILELKNKDITTEYYGILNIMAIASAINNGENLNEVFERFNLDNEQRALVLLICARECFMQGYMANGEAYLKMVEKIPEKTTLVKRMINETRKDKNYYQNKKGSNYEPLINASKRVRVGSFRA